MLEKKNINVYITGRYLVTINTNNKKNIIKICVIILCAIVILLFFAWFVFSRSIFALNNPDKSLEVAIDFIKSEEYVGMTEEECEAIFGDTEKVSPVKVLSYEVGTFNDGWWPARYEIVIYFNEDELVENVRLQEIKE